MKLSEIVREVISLAQAANQARAVTGSEDDSPIITSGGVWTPTKMPRTTAEERRLREFLEGQSPSVVYMLLAIMYLGRGDFDAKDLLDQFIETSETFGGPQWAAMQMLGKLPLPGYLEEGLRKLDRAGMNLDDLFALAAAQR